MSNREGTTYRTRNRRLENVPADVRHSLDILDDILGQFDAEEQRLDAAQRSLSSLAVRSPGDFPQDVRKSLEVFDSILDEIEQDNPPPVSRRHFRNSPIGTLDKKNRHEDIRRSLDVLDSVLAEFDDCLESWDTHFDDKKLELTDFNSNAVKSKNVILSEAQLSFAKSPRDVTTSHISPSIVPEQPRVVSPPPIPKRSPATKLSERNASVFTFPENDNSLDSFDSPLSPTDHVPQQRIRGLLSSDCDAHKCPPDKCANCGRGLKKMMEQQQQQTGGEETTSSSPFHQRKQMFEARIAEASANLSRSPSLNRSYGSSFKTKRLETSSDQSANLSSGESGFEERFGKNLSELSVDCSTGVKNGHHAAKCTYKDKIRQLDAKFADVRRLIKLNKIRGLDSKPPGFVPHPPPVVSNGHQTNSQLDKLASSPKINLGVKSSRDNQPKTSTFNDSSLDVSLQSTDYHSLRSASSTNSLATCDSRLTDSSFMCNRCLSSLSIHTIEDLPKLLPTDALNRPHLGFSYSMEDDLPPGVKEIQQTTSTPKSDVSSPRLFRTKESNLSTFSHSASSLGYISSQSDLELNDLSILPDKVPVSSFKSRTLPNGLDRSPFYSSADDTFDKSYCEVIDHNDNRLSPAHAKSALDIPKKGAPLPPEPPEKTKTKHFRVFSRKSKKDKKKTGGTP